MTLTSILWSVGVEGFILFFSALALSIGDFFLGVWRESAEDHATHPEKPLRYSAGLGAVLLFAFGVSLPLVSTASIIINLAKS